MTDKKDDLELGANKKTKEDVRKERVSIRQQRTIAFQERPGWKRRLVNDEPGRIQMFLKAGWTIVQGEENNLSDRLSHTEHQIGSAVRKVVNKGATATAHHGILMEIPLELWKQDQLEKDKEVNKLDAAIDPSKTSQTGHDYGYINIDSSQPKN